MIGSLLAIGGLVALGLYAAFGQEGPTVDLAASVQGWLNNCRVGRPGSPAVLVETADPTRAPALERDLPPGYDAILILTPGDWLLYHISGGKRMYMTVNHWQVLYARGDCPPEIAPELYAKEPDARVSRTGGY